MENQPSILLVEDDQFTARMMELQLAKNGMGVVMAENGSQALARMADQSFDLVLTDMVMPEMTGTELVSIIRKEHTKEALPVLVITGLDNMEIVRMALDAGANDFIPKTGEFGVILSRVKHFLEVGRLRACIANGNIGARAPGDGLWNWNIAADEIYLSTRWKAILGFDAEELGKSPQEWFGRIHPEDAARVSEGIGAHLKRRVPSFQMDYRMRCKNNKYLWVHSFGVALFGKEGKPKRMLGPMCSLDDGNRLANIQKCTRVMSIELKNLASNLPGDSSARGDLKLVLSRFDQLKQLLLESM